MSVFLWVVVRESECVCNPPTYILKTELLWAFNTMHVYALELALVYLHTKVHQVFAGSE